MNEQIKHSELPLNEHFIPGDVKSPLVGHVKAIFHICQNQVIPEDVAQSCVNSLPDTEGKDLIQFTIENWNKAASSASLNSKQKDIFGSLAMMNLMNKLSFYDNNIQLMELRKINMQLGVTTLLLEDFS